MPRPGRRDLVDIVHHRQEHRSSQWRASWHIRRVLGVDQAALACSVRAGRAARADRREAADRSWVERRLVRKFRFYR